jgi:RNA polymerase sigma-70 factor (ECF subfamily)
LAYRLTRDAHAADDIRQSAFLRAYERLGDFNGRAAFSTWLYRIAVNLCRDWQRSSQAQERVLQVARRAPRESRAAARPPAEESEAARCVAQAVQALPAAFREVVVMRHYLELSFAEIAEIVEAPVSTVKSRMTRGLRLLRESLEDVHP